MDKTENSKDKMEEFGEANYKLGYSQALQEFKKSYLTLEDANKAINQARHDLLIEFEKIIDDYVPYEDVRRAMKTKVRTKLEKLKE